MVRPHRNTTVRDHHRRTIARNKPPCGICGGEIDYTLRYPDPMSYVVDHVLPVHHGGTDELANKQAAHNTCNRLKWDRVDGDQEPAITFVTSRSW
jgi:5-methylcytosine-specific restriction endonuclease McrA